jgi:hypothetical protein
MRTAADGRLDRPGARRRQRLPVWLGALLVLAPAAGAAEPRFQIDPGQDLAALIRTGQTVISVERVNGVYALDASAVLRVDLQSLLAASLDYERYPRMGVPNVRESHVVWAAPDGDQLCTWSRLSYLGQSSQHYLAVGVARNLTPSGAAGIHWQLVPARPSWPFPEASAFRRLDGSWYLEPLGPDLVYVRYFAVAGLDPGIPDAIVSWVIRRQLAAGARDLIQALGREAASRTLALRP